MPEGGIGLRDLQIGIVESADCSNVLPVAIEEEGLDMHATFFSSWNHFSTEVVCIWEVILQQLLHDFSLDHIDSHACNVRHVLCSVTAT